MFRASLVVGEVCVTGTTILRSRVLGNPQSDRRSGTVLETGGAGDGSAEFNRREAD